MTPQSQLAKIEQALGEIRAALAMAQPGPKTRELRARATTFERAFMNLTGRVPTREQTSALMDGVLELHAQVFESKRPPPAMKLTSPALSTPAIRAVTAVTNPRVVLPAPRPSQRPTVKPPPVASRPPSARSVPPSTLPPPSSSGRR